MFSIGTWLKTLSSGKEITLYNTISALKDPKEEALGNIAGKGENASILSSFHSVFYSIKEKNRHSSKV